MMISETLLYVCFSVLVGGTLLSLVPENKKPLIVVPRTIMSSSLVGIVFLSLFPVINLVYYYVTNLNYEVGYVAYTVLTDYKVGTGWIYTVFIATVLFYLLEIKPPAPGNKLGSYAKFLLSIALVFTMGWSSHAATIYEWGGFLAHTIHFLAITLWMGVMLVTAWFAQDKGNWIALLRWFTPLAILCMIASITAGIVLASYISPDYYNSWMLSYGQALLIKHIAIIPLLWIAFINGFLIKARLIKDEGFDPRPWLKIESMIVLFIFSVTAYLGQQSPPHNVIETLKEEKPASLFLWLYQGKFHPEMKVSLFLNWGSILLAVMACLCLLVALVVFRERKPLHWAFISCILFVVLCYVSVMLAIR